MYNNLRSLESHISTSNFHRSSFNWSKVFVFDKPLHSPVSLSQKPQQRLPVILPECLKYRHYTADLHMQDDQHTCSSSAGGNLQQDSSRVTSMQPCQM